jgi:hypothetical protein
MVAWRAAAFLSLVVLSVPRPAHAGNVDTQFLFGFTQGADVGTFGEKEIESQTLGRFGKADGSYTALASQLRAEFTPFRNSRFEIGTFATYHSIAGVSGLDDRDSVQFGGFVAEARYRLIDRRSAPVSLTVGVEPHWQRVNDIGGELVSSWGGDLSLALDKELLEDRLFAALNLLYAPEWTNQRQQSTMGISGAAVWQVAGGVFVGAESHYLRAYDGIGLNSFAGATPCSSDRPPTGRRPRPSPSPPPGAFRSPAARSPSPAASTSVTSNATRCGCGSSTRSDQEPKEKPS